MGKKSSKYQIKCEMTYPYYIKFKKKRIAVHHDYFYTYYIPKKKIDLFKLGNIDSVIFKFKTSSNEKVIPIKFNPDEFEIHQRQKNYVKEISYQISGKERYIFRISHKNIIKELVKVTHI